MSKKIKMDAQGYSDLLQEIADAEQRLNILRQSDSKSNVDASSCDNSEMEEEFLLKQIRDLKNTLSYVEIVESLNAIDCVDIGSTVKILLDFCDETEEGIFVLIAHNNIKENEISINSPLGAAILGKKENDCVQYKVGTNIIKATILELIS